MPSTFLETVGRFTRSPGFKFFFVLLLVLLLMIPLGLIWFLVSEREGRARVVTSDIAALWGRQQHVTGPFLVVPYMVKIVTTQGDQNPDTDQRRRPGDGFVPD